MSTFALGDCCPNTACADHGKLQSEHQQNIIKFGKTKAGRQLFKCNTCGYTFTETKGTLFYRRRTPDHWLKLQRPGHQSTCKSTCQPPTPQGRPEQIGTDTRAERRGGGGSRAEEGIGAGISSMVNGFCQFLLFYQNHCQRRASFLFYVFSLLQQMQHQPVIRNHHILEK
jgi:hypothetical protein